MDFFAILSALGVLVVLGIIFGLVLEFASKKFKIEDDGLVIRVREALPGANCGACGYPGCDGYAAAVASGEAPTNGCPVGRRSNLSERLDEIMGTNG